ncbi:hypothetical protein A2V94_07135 [Candidatus Atribacteria bacterium RBG_16_35_8]|nr:MAG: hypothetical protein A2V94_07135 [Candidatus Atribacteria bacterium RBG_16_35_8]
MTGAGSGCGWRRRPRILDGMSGSISRRASRKCTPRRNGFLWLGRCCRDTQDLLSFVKWLINLGYPKHIAIFAAKSIVEEGE